MYVADNAPVCAYTVTASWRWLLLSLLLVAGLIFCALEGRLARHLCHPFWPRLNASKNSVNGSGLRALACTVLYACEAPRWEGTERKGKPKIEHKDILQRVMTEAVALSVVTGKLMFGDGRSRNVDNPNRRHQREEEAGKVRGEGKENKCRGESVLHCRLYPNWGLSTPLSVPVYHCFGCSQTREQRRGPQIVPASLTEYSS